MIEIVVKGFVGISVGTSLGASLRASVGASVEASVGQSVSGIKTGPISGRCRTTFDFDAVCLVNLEEKGLLVSKAVFKLPFEPKVRGLHYACSKSVHCLY